MQFTKLFNSILDSTIWQEPPATKLVWITLLAMADRAGDVHASIPGLAKRAGVTLPECEAALTCLTSPDRYSRTKEHDGRRIEIIDGGFALLNHSKYRALLSAEERREYNRTKQAEYRAAKKSDVNYLSPNVNDNKQNAHSTEGEGEAEAVLPSPHTHQARGAQEEEYWPDPREYPTVETVKQWAEQVMVSPACAEKWHATRVSENWETRNHRPLQLDSLPALFRTYATAWKAREAPVGKSNGYTNKPRNQALQRDVTAGKTAAQIGDIFGEHT
jgi:hypothetical protein